MESSGGKFADGTVQIGSESPGFTMPRRLGQWSPKGELRRQESGVLPVPELSNYVG